jgi:hypothetical protein
VTRKEDGSIARTRVAGGPLDKQMADIVASTASQEEGLYVIHVKLVLGDLQELGRADSALTAECFVKLGQLVSIDDHPLPDAQLNALLRRVADQLAGAVIEPMLSCCERACKEEQLVAFRALREDHADNHSLRALGMVRTFWPPCVEQAGMARRTTRSAQIWSPLADSTLSSALCALTPQKRVSGRTLPLS